MSASKLKFTIDHYARLAPLGVMILHYTSFRPVLTCQKQTFAELEQTAREFFVFPANAQLKFFTTFATDDMLRIDPEAWPRIYQMVNALWIEIDLSPAIVGGTMAGTIQRSAPNPGPTPLSTATPSAGATSSDQKQTPASGSGRMTPKSTATPSAGAKSSGANQTSVSGSGPAPTQSKATPNTDATSSDKKQTSASSSGHTTPKSAATPNAGTKSSDANQTSASGSGEASTQTTATPKADPVPSGPNQTSVSDSGPATPAPKTIFGSMEPLFSFRPSSAPSFGAKPSTAPALVPTSATATSAFTFSSAPTSRATHTLPPRPSAGRFAKPVVYLYPPTPTTVNVRLSLISPWEFSAIYPLVTVKHLESGPLVGRESITWDILASPDGQLHLSDGLQVSYLYWEAETRSTVGIDTPPSSRPLTPEWVLPIERFDPSNPILTPQNSVLLRVPGGVTNYLDKALLALGLHTEARTSFITYWLPSFVKNEYVALRFVEQSSYEAAARLDITPKPDVVTRVFMLFRGVDSRSAADWSAAAERAKDMDVAKWKSIVGVDVEKMKSEELFRVLEWGGMEVYR